VWCDTPVTDPIEAPGTSPEAALSVREVSRQLTSYVAALPRIWIEGQVISARTYGRLVYITLRDPDVDMSISVIAAVDIVGGVSPAVEEGSRIVIFADAEWWTKKGSLHLRAHAIRSVGLGDLLARIEMLRRTLDAEGLFRTDRKKPLPFLPRKIGLITGRDTDAFKDVVVNARRRWPAAAFEVREIALLRADTPLTAAAAMRELEAIADVDVIVIARGGGSFEDLLPWSDEGLVRAVATCTKSVVSAIGHEADRPILDDVADVRASTPTDAARKIVPDLEEETARISRATARLHDLRSRWLADARRQLELVRQALLSRSPKSVVATRLREVKQLRIDLRGSTQLRIERETQQLAHRRGQLAALSPFAVLARGYAVATTLTGEIVRNAEDVGIGQDFSVRVHQGTLSATRITDPPETTPTPKKYPATPSPKAKKS